MSVALSDLVARLTAMVPARDSVPSAAQYEQAVVDAVAQFSQDSSYVRYDTLAIVSGTASYALPDDFLFLVELESLYNPSGVIIGTDGLIPVSASYEETYAVDGQSITFWPTPSYSTSRTFRYGAQHVLDGDSAYPRLTENGARIAMLYAKHLVLGIQAAAVAGDGWKYKIGDEEIDTSKVGAGILTASQDALTQYQSAMAGIRRIGGMRSAYNSQGL